MSLSPKRRRKIFHEFSSQSRDDLSMIFSSNLLFWSRAKVVENKNIFSSLLISAVV